jgi:hypothetical protein
MIWGFFYSSKQTRVLMGSIAIYSL